MSLSATLTIDASMIAMIRPSMTVSVIMASGGLALRSARRSAADSDLLAITLYHPHAGRGGSCKYPLA